MGGDEANAAIRALVARTTSWGPEELAELARLRREWMQASTRPVGRGDVVKAA